jgi:6-pyruvoyltetrahydropterin/6-carboxytetrahydropterin synthase
MAVVLERRMRERFPDTVSDVAVTVAETRELRAGH